MDDGLPNPNVFDQYDPDKTPIGIPAPETTQDNQPAPQANPFDDLGDVVPEPISTTGAVARGAEKSLLPAAGSLAAAGAGAELGGAAGTAVLPGIGTVVGALAGGIGGGILGAKGVDAAQNWLLSKLPDSFVDAFGLDERKERLDQQQHPVASFVGGLVPYAVTMRPSGFAKTPLPENATALQTLMAHPVTAKLFGGGVMGGMELANEKADGQDLDWRKVAIATGFGVIFNKPNMKIGEPITEFGAGPVRGVLGRPGPTVAQAGDLKVMGPGVTESVFHGTQEQAPEAAMMAQETARTEQAALGEAPEPDVGNIARRMEPDLFGRYDDLLKRQETFQAWHGEGPGAEAAEKHLATTAAEIEQMGPDVAAAYRRAADTMGTGTVAPEQFPSLAAMLTAHEHQTGVVPRETAANLPEVPNAPENAGAAAVLHGVHPGGPEGVHQEVAGTGPEGVIGQLSAPNSIPRPQRSIGEQRAFIANDVSQKLIAAGRPAEEAEASGQLIAARYVTRAGRFEGKLGTPEELYSREAAAIAGPTGKPLEPARPPAWVPEEAKAAPAEDLNAMLARKATPTEISQHPIVKAANETNRAVPRTDLRPDYGTPEFEENREFNINGEKVTGYEQALPKLVDKAKSYSTKGPVKQEREATIVLGPPAAGKSRLSERLASEKHAAIADPDDVKTTLPEYNGGLGSTAVHEESAKIAGNVLHELVKNGDNIVLPRVGGKLDAVKKYVDALHDAGYKVNMVNMTVEPHEAYRRMIGRFLKTGRIIGSDYFEGVGTKPRENFYAVKDEGKVNEAVDVDANGPAGSAKAIVGGDTELAKALALGGPGGGGGQALAGGHPEGEEVKELLQKEGEPRIVSSKAMQEAVLKNEWGRNGRDLDFEDIWQNNKTNKIWEREVDAWNEKHGADFDYDQAYNDSNGFRDYFDKKYLEGKKAPFPGVQDANEYFGESGDFHLGAYLAGEEPDTYELGQAANASIRPASWWKWNPQPFDHALIKFFKSANASSMIHESGHQFLEELMRDADHPEAPPGLRDDAQTVRDWLGVTDDIKTKHHEKFARGFEQYMREGVAPSPGLAGVFAKFRNWLLTIYQSLKGLGAEINPDIRGVFDRMLEMEPQRTVVAPERQSPTLLHDIHEAEAANVPPHEAEATMDRVVAERDRYISEQPPEVQRELEAAASKVEAVETAAGKTSGAPGEAFSGAVGQPEVGEGGGGPGPQPGGGADGEEHAEIKPGGANTGAEGAGGATTDLRSGLGKDAGTALAPGPSDLFGARESPFIDKAGNIRLDNVNTDEDIKQVFRDFAAQNNDFIGDRQGKVTDGQVLDAAYKVLGSTPDFYLSKKIGEAFNAIEIKAMEVLASQSARTVHEAMIKASTGTDADVLAYGQARTRHQMIQAKFSQATAESGRAQRALRKTQELWSDEAKQGDMIAREGTGKTLYQLRAEARLGAELKTPQQVSKMMQDVQKHSFGSMVLEYWINGLISGPATHMTYMVGNTILSILKVPETAVAAGVSRVATALGREGTGVRSGEASAMVTGAREGFPAAIKAGVEALKTGVTTQLPGEVPPKGTLPLQPGSELAQPAQFQEGATYHDAMATMFGIVRGMRDGVLASGKLLAAGGVQGEPLIGTQYSPLGAIPDITLKGVNVLPLGSVVRVPGRFIASIHSFYRSINFSMEKNALAYRTAAEEGLTGDALASRVAQIRADPSEAQMNEIATHAATQTVLMGKGSELTQALSRVTNAKVFGFPLLKFIDPFVHISGNIIEQAVIQRTPVGLLTMLGPETELARDLTGKNGNASQDKAIGRMMVGTALSVTFGGLAAQGLMSGSGPSDPKESAMWRLAGNQAHSIRVGDMWYDTHRLGPIGMLAGIAADMYDVSHDAAKGDLLQAAAHLQHAFAQNILDESFMRGPAELIQAIEDPGRYGESYIRNFLSSFVPFSVGMSQMARATDPYTRQARTTMDAIKAKIPGMSETLMPRRDIWGEPMPSREVLGPAGLSAIYAQRMSNDPVNKAMLDIAVYPAQVEKKIRNVELTPQEYDTYSQVAGRMTKQNLDKIVKSPMWATMPIEAKRYAVQHTIESCREAARGIMFGKYPHIVHDGTVAQQARMRGEKP